jgi:hypothetical protein
MKNAVRGKRVTANEWMEYHPYEQPLPDDYYYLKLCNSLLKKNVDEMLCHLLSWSEYKKLTCVLVCWFEDVVSETNIWRSFTGEHQKLYGKYLPFYDTSNNYFDDEINPQDIQFLIWHFYSMLYADRLINPVNEYFESFAQATFAFFEEVYETAPQNLQFKTALTVPIHKDVYITRNIMEFLFYKSYLNRQFSEQQLEEAKAAIAKDQLDIRSADIEEYNCRIALLIDKAMPMLALRANEQLAAIIGENHPQYHEIKTISKRYTVTCVVTGYSEAHLNIEHIATGKQINLMLKTISEFDKNSVVPGKKRLWANIVKWGNEWALMGTLVFIETWEGNKGIADEKYIFDPIEPKLKALEFHEECFRELTGGECLVYLDSNTQRADFIDHFRKRMHEKTNQGKILPPSDGIKQDEVDSEIQVLFFNHHAGLESYSNIPKCINDVRNPYYVQGFRADMQSLLIDKEVSAQFVKHLVTHRLIEPSLLKAMDDNAIFDYLDFLLRYYKQNYYYSEPRITIVN